MPLSPFVTSISDCPTYSLLGDVGSLLASGKQTGGSYCLFRLKVGPGNGTPPHMHTREDETFIVLKGELTMWCNGERLVLRAGDVAFGPKDVPHHYLNETASTVEVMVLAVPAGFDDFTIEAAYEVPAGSECTAPDPAQIQKVLDACPRYGIKILSPAP